jgi:hypothetical protein
MSLQYAQVSFANRSTRHRLLLDLRRQRPDLAPAEGRGDQPRSQSAAAVPGRDGPQSVSERTDLPEMLAYARFPEGLFTGSPATMQAIRDAVQRAQGR